jgi:hypothetical protein
MPCVLQLGHLHNLPVATMQKLLSRISRPHKVTASKQHMQLLRARGMLVGNTTKVALLSTTAVAQQLKRHHTMVQLATSMQQQQQVMPVGPPPAAATLHQATAAATLAAGCAAPGASLVRASPAPPPPQQQQQAPQQQQQQQSMAVWEPRVQSHAPISLTKHQWTEQQLAVQRYGLLKLRSVSEEHKQVVQAQMEHIKDWSCQPRGRGLWRLRRGSRWQKGVGGWASVCVRPDPDHMQVYNMCTCVFCDVSMQLVEQNPRGGPRGCLETVWYTCVLLTAAAPWHTMLASEFQPPTLQGCYCACKHSFHALG